MRHLRARWPADGPLYLLFAVAGALLAALSVLGARSTLPYDPLVACETLVTTAVARLGTLGLMLPAGLMSIMVLAAVLALVHQVWATRRVLDRVLAARRPLGTRLTALAERAGLAGRLDRVADEAVYTFCYGLRRPRVCVSSGLVAMLDDEELLAVLRHEAHHMRHNDPIKILLGRVVASGLFFLPLGGALRNGFLAGKELCADADAAAGDDELPLARALVKMLHAERPSWPAGVLAIGALSPTEARLQRIVAPNAACPTLPAPADWIVSAAVVAGIFGFSIGATAAGHAAPVSAACASDIAHTMELPAQLRADGGTWAR